MAGRTTRLCFWLGEFLSSSKIGMLIEAHWWAPLTASSRIVFLMLIVGLFLMFSLVFKRETLQLLMTILGLFTSPSLVRIVFDLVVCDCSWCLIRGRICMRPVLRLTDDRSNRWAIAPADDLSGNSLASVSCWFKVICLTVRLTVKEKTFHRNGKQLITGLIQPIKRLLKAATAWWWAGQVSMILVCLLCVEKCTRSRKATFQ